MGARRLEEAYDYSYGYSYEHEMPKKVEKVEEPKQTPVTEVKLNTHLRVCCCILVTVVGLIVGLKLLGKQYIASRGYAYVQMKQEIARLEQENEQLKIEIAKMRAPQRIKDIAINSLGMSIPKEVYFATEKR